MAHDGVIRGFPGFPGGGSGGNADLLVPRMKREGENHVYLASMPGSSTQSR